MNRLNFRRAVISLFQDGWRFAIIGACGYAIDVLLFNAILWANSGTGADIQVPIIAKVISASIATFATWLGNRYWTFRSRRRSARVRELLEFGLVATGGIAISVLCLWVSRFVLGFDSLLADNVATNVVGFVLATLFRFLMYRHWVFGKSRAHLDSGENVVSSIVLAGIAQEGKDTERSR